MQVLPKLPIEYAAYRGFIHTKHFPDSSGAKTCFGPDANNLNHHFLGELYVACVFSRPVRISPFGAHVLHIVFLSSQKQMVWIDAPRVVATVQNEFAIRDSSEMDHPRKAMGGAISTSKAAPYDAIPGFVF